VATTNNQSNDAMSLSGAGNTVGQVLEDAVRELAVSTQAGATGNAQLSTQVEQLRTANQVQTDTVAQNTQAVIQNTLALATGTTGSGSGGVGGIFGKIFGSALGLSPLISGLIGLFGGGGEKAVPVLTQYTLPPSVNIEGSIVRSAAEAAPTPAPSSGSTTSAGGTAPQVTIQVQAMDSRSFLDHSTEIAQAVRAAMLNSNSLNDVVNDL
jgi:hypothetical protein